MTSSGWGWPDHPPSSPVLLIGRCYPAFLPSSSERPKLGRSFLLFAALIFGIGSACFDYLPRQFLLPAAPICVICPAHLCYLPCSFRFSGSLISVIGRAHILKSDGSRKFVWRYLSQQRKSATSHWSRDIIRTTFNFAPIKRWPINIW
jgi:hypothetical protein